MVIYNAARSFLLETFDRIAVDFQVTLIDTSLFLTVGLEDLGTNLGAVLLSRKLSNRNRLNSFISTSVLNLHGQQNPN